MTRWFAIVLLGTAALCAAALRAQSPDISGDRIRAHVKFLSSDRLEGRGPGAHGGDLAAEYIATQFARFGLKPAGDKGTFLQHVPLVGATTDPDSTVTADRGGQEIQFRWLDDVVGVTNAQQPDVPIDGDAIFVGHGIVAPEFQWDDFKGVDVRGKILILFTNQPASDDPKFFGGKALTYYGRWTYKYEEATRRGAQAVFIIHTTPTAGYGYDVVRSSWGREDGQVKLEPGEQALSFAGWFSKEAGDKLLGLSGHNVEELLKLAESRDFHPIPLGVHIFASFQTKLRQIDSSNVVGMVEGSDPVLKNEAVVFTAHWDHLGIGTPVNGDAIYNGAVDNATGCGILLEMARAWASLPHKPRRSAIFLAVTGEEEGLRGSAYYAAHPFIPAKRTALDLNFDAFFPAGLTRDVSAVGGERTTVWPVVQEVARSMNLTIKPDAHPEQGSYYRSDHFSFAQAGVPAFSIDEGTDFVGKPADFGAKLFDDYNEKHYHQPSDEFHEDWDFSGLAQMTRFGMSIGMAVANQSALPTWRAGDEFLPARQKSGVK
jgi:Zn-dependent M28 family amino/carboxypeptidase